MDAQTQPRLEPATRPTSSPGLLDDDASWLPMVLRRARERPDDVWMVQPTGGGATRDYRFAEAVDEARRIASHLIGLGYPPGSAIAILSQNCAQFILMDLAIWMAGHVTVPLYPTMTPDAVRFVLDHCQARAIFVGKLPGAPAPGAIPDHLDGLSCAFSPPTRFPRWEDVVARTEPLAGVAARSADEVVAILYTSGTTARPKGVEQTFGAMAATARALLAICPGGPDDRLISYLPLAHIAERLLVEALSFETGARIYFCESVETFADDLRRARPTYFAGVPRVWMKLRDRITARIPEARLRRLLKTPVLSSMVRRKIRTQLGFDALRYCGSGAAPCPKEVFEFFAALGIEMQELYGMTENFGYSHFCPRGAHRGGWTGPPLPGAVVRLADDGEVQIRSPGVMRGYHRDPEASRAAFTDDGFLRTGDRGEIGPDGYLRIVGRTKEIFKTSKGKYVAPSGIENALLATGLLEMVCVMGYGEPQPFAVATLAESTQARATNGGDGRVAVQADLSVLLDAVNRSLPPHERLSRLVVSSAPWTIEDGLLTPTLKVKRGNVEERFVKRVAAAPAGVSWLSAEA